MSAATDRTAQIDEALDQFDFERVHRVMVALDWRWGDEHVPEVSALRKKARRLLRDLGEDAGAISTGGFTAECDAEGSIELSFRVSEVRVLADGTLD